MLSVILFGLAAAIYPQLLAVVLLIFTLDNARIALWTCCIAGIVTSTAINFAIYAVFRAHGTVAGTSENLLGPSAYLGIGTAALVIAMLIGTRTGRTVLVRSGQRLPDPRTVLRRTPGTPAGVPAPEAAAPRKPSLNQRLEAALHGGAPIIAAAVGAVLAIPGPFDFLATGRLALNDDGIVEALIAVFVFAVLKFLLIAIPSIAYVVSPDETARRVSAFSRWMHDNRLLAIAIFVGIVGAILVGHGLAGLG